MSYPMSKAQYELLEILRKKNNIAPDTMNALCGRLFETEYRHLSMRQASSLIISFKSEVEAVLREVALVAGQQPLFEVLS